jgi:hypothetical protein
MSAKIVIATSKTPDKLDTTERLLMAALTGMGFEVRPAIWSDPAIDWGRFQLVVLRSCWDYHLRLPEFWGGSSGWLSRIFRF